MQELCPTQGDGPPAPPQELVGEWLCDDGYPWDPSEHVTITITTNRLRNVAAKAAAWGYRQAREDARRVEARELSAFGLLAGLDENTTADGGDSDG
jgi:hypothetical protein